MRSRGSDGVGWTLVTGGTGGLGVAVVESLAAQGHRVLVSWVMERELEAFPAALGKRVELRRVDVGEPEAVRSTVAGCAAGGGLRAVAHLVGGYADGTPLGGGALDVLDRQVELNLRTAAVVLDAALPVMVEAGFGRAVVVGSRAGVRPFAGAGPYAASKAAVVALAQAAAEEGRSAGVTVNAVLPSVIDTPGNRAAQPDADHSRWVRPAEIAAVIAFLLSDEASAVSGAAIPVYGRA